MISRRVLLFLVLAWAAAAYADPSFIREIQFEGNRVTRPGILLQELTIHVGDRLDLQELENSRQALMNLGLFKSVQADVKDDGVVVFRMKEKHYYLAIPELDRDDNNDINFGLNLYGYNLGGLNQSLRITYDTQSAKDATSGDDRSYSLLYTYPRIAGTQYGFELALAHKTNPLQEVTGNVVTADYEEQSSDMSFLISRWLNRKGPTTGWRVGAGAVFRTRNYDYISGTPGLYRDGDTIGLLAFVGNTDITDHLYSRTGHEYGYSLEQGLSALGSDYSYSRHEIFYRNYQNLWKPHQNLNTQIRIGLSQGRLFGEDAYAIGSSSKLRGYGDEVSGDAYVLANIEYLQPLFGRNYLRGVVFLDMGNAYPNNQDIDLGDLKTAAGVGLRYNFKGFVNLNLRVDYVYNADTGETSWIAASKNTF